MCVEGAREVADDLPEERLTRFARDAFLNAPEQLQSVHYTRREHDKLT
jgi:hypothetical protein